MMHEDELRRVLQELDAPEGMSAPQLSERVIRRGKTIKRQRTALTALVISGIAASALGVANMLPGQQNAVPAQHIKSPSASATPRPNEDEQNDDAKPEAKEGDEKAPKKAQNEESTTEEKKRSETTSEPTRVGATAPNDTRASSPERQQQDRESDEPRRQAPNPPQYAPEASAPVEQPANDSPETPTDSETTTLSENANPAQVDEETQPERRPVTDPSSERTVEDPLPEPTVLWGDSTVLPDDVGDLGDFRLAGESFPGDDLSTPYEPMAPSVSMCRTTSVPEITKVVAGRSRMSYGPNYSDTESILVFSTDEDAANFMAASRREQEACARDGMGDSGEPPSEYEPDVTFTFAVKDGSIGEQSHIASARAHHTLPDTGEVVDFPGGELWLYTRQGRVVIMGSSAGEYTGDLAAGEHGILDAVSSAARQNLSAADAQFN